MSATSFCPIIAARASMIGFSAKLSRLAETDSFPPGRPRPSEPGKREASSGIDASFSLCQSVLTRLPRRDSVHGRTKRFVAAAAVKKHNLAASPTGLGLDHMVYRLIGTYFFTCCLTVAFYLLLFVDCAVSGWWWFVAVC